MKQTSVRWRARTQALTRAPRLPVGTSFHFRLDRAAEVRLAFTRLLSGRRVGGRCGAPAAGNRSKPRCTRRQSRGMLRIAGRDGANALAFRGRVAGRMLPPGRYRLSATAHRDGRTSATATILFTIVG